ncbi:MAG: hypothetical protein HKN42_00755 [Granulosicoccus sp.]|nr:hypothetical protein [Granulosicoccus sp.]
MSLVLSAVVPVHASASELIATPAVVELDDTRQQLLVTTIDWQWQLALREKRLLGHSAALQQALFDIPRFFDGQVQNEDDSWVRLSHEQLDGDRFSGHIFTGGELYELQYRDDMGGHALARLSGTKAAGFPFEAGMDASKLAHPDDSSPDTPEPTFALSLESALSGKLSTVPTAGSALLTPRAIRIGIVVDSRYNDKHNGRGLAHALGIINGVDGLYQSQLGLAILVDSFRIYDDPGQDPLRDFQGDVDQMLGAYRDIRLNDDELPADLALVHLFSGHGDPQKIIGLGWIGTACRLDGYDLSLSTPFPYDMLLSAHEIGHNLGAPHDDDPDCNADDAATGNEVMWSELSGATRPEFSVCSLDNMRSMLAADCVIDDIDVGVTLSAESAGSARQQSVTVTVVNQDSTRTARGVTSTTVFPAGTSLSSASAGCRIHNDSQLLCQHDPVASDGKAALSVVAEFTQDTLPVITSELSYSAFTDTDKLDNRAALQITLDDSIPWSALSSSEVPGDPDPTAQSGTATGELPAQASEDAGLPLRTGGSAGTGAGSSGPTALLTGVLAILFSILRQRMARRRPDPLITHQTGRR